jgi:hypothetical protein
MNDALREAEAVDPQWARSEQRKLWLLKGITAAVMLALAVGTVSFILGIHNSTEITHVEKTVENSACQEDAAGPKCQKAKTESAEAANIHVSCIPFEKVAKPGFLKRTKCDEAAETTTTRPPSGGDASTNPTVHSLPAPGNGGEHGSGGSHGTHVPGEGGSHHAPAPGKGGSGGASAPGTAASPAPTSSSSSQQSSSSSTERVESPVEAPQAEAAQPVREGIGGLLGGVGAVVEETGATVNQTVEGATGTTCSLAKVLCPE